MKYPYAWFGAIVFSLVIVSMVTHERIPNTPMSQRRLPCDEMRDTEKVYAYNHAIVTNASELNPNTYVIVFAEKRVYDFSRIKNFVINVYDNQNQVVAYIIPLDQFYKVPNTRFNGSGFIIHKKHSDIFVTNWHVVGAYRWLDSLFTRLENRDIGYIKLGYDPHRLLLHPLDFGNDHIAENEQLFFHGVNCDKDFKEHYIKKVFPFSPLYEVRDSTYSEISYFLPMDVKSNYHGMSGAPVLQAGRVVGIFTGYRSCSNEGLWERIYEDDISIED